ncbi:MAG: menaquinol-cytochrome c reductase cytochrome b subunit [Acidimicrobiales bacterium]|nr:menaquinol-cytochrome c reductase cytochrome b subunit [Acidimicrobiales bacterium]
MTEIPEHLRKRAEAAKQKAEAKKAAESGAAPAAPAEGAPAAAAAAAAPAGGTGGGGDRIPAHLLDRSRSAAQNAGLEVAAPAGAVATAVADARPVASGPGGHTQRLLTVVKSGSIQDVRATPQDKVHTWPHLLVAEFVAALLITAFTFIFSVFVNAPLLQLANLNQTPNPSKAPWYFLGLQELLTMFHPMVAGVTIPGMGLFVLGMAPYVDKNPSNKPEDRKFAISLMTVHLMFWSVLVMIGSFFRGPGFNFVFPWTSGLFFEL